MLRKRGIAVIVYLLQHNIRFSALMQDTAHWNMLALLYEPLRIGSLRHTQQVQAAVDTHMFLMCCDRQHTCQKKINQLFVKWQSLLKLGPWGFKEVSVSSEICIWAGVWWYLEMKRKTCPKRLRCSQKGWCPEHQRRRGRRAGVSPLPAGYSFICVSV